MLKNPIRQIFKVRLGLIHWVWMSEKKKSGCNGNDIYGKVNFLWHLCIVSGMKKLGDEKKWKLIFQREWKGDRESDLVNLGNEPCSSKWSNFAS